MVRESPSPQPSTSSRRADDALRAAAEFDNPPRQLRALHRPRWLGELWLDIRRHADEPVRTFSLANDTCVEILGIARYIHTGWGGFRVYSRSTASRGPRWLPVARREALVIGMRWRDAWLRAIRARIDARGRTLPSKGDPRCEAYAQWMFGQIAARVRREVDFSRLRLRVDDALSLQAYVVRRARRVPASCNREEHGITLRLDIYERVLGSTAYATLEQEAPNLLPLFGVLSRMQGFPDTGQPVERLRDYLWVRGISRAGWRLIARSPARLWLRHLHFYTGAVGEAVVDLLRLVDLLRGESVPPAWFLRTILALHGNHFVRREGYVERMGARMRVLQRLAQLVEQADDVTRARMRDEFHGIADWIVGDWLLRGYNWRQLDWKWFAEQAAKYAEGVRRSAATDRGRWPIPFTHLRCGQLDAVPLANSFELWREGEAMRHCAAHYGDACAEGSALIVSFRDPARARPVCTAQYDLQEGHWTLRQACGFANTTPPARVLAIVQSLAPQLDAHPREAWIAPALPARRRARGARRDRTDGILLIQQ